MGHPGWPQAHLSGKRFPRAEPGARAESRGSWWQEWASAAGAACRLPLTSTVTSDLSLTGRRALQKAPRIPWAMSRSGEEVAVPGRASQACCSFSVPKGTTDKHSDNQTAASPGSPLCADPRAEVYMSAFAAGAAAKILVYLPSLLAEPTSADATGMLLSEVPVLPRWQKPWFTASSAGDPSMKDSQRPRSRSLV